MSNLSASYLFFLLVIATCVSCVVNTDFEQSKDFELTPVVELDLLYFDVDANQFFDSINNTPIFTIRDSTGLEFLEGENISQTLKRAEFFFKFENQIPRTFEVTLDFTSIDNEITYTTQTTVTQGSVSQTQTTYFTPVFEEEDIEQLTMANRILVNVTIPSSSANLSGSLNLQSKVTYFLQIN